MSAELSLELKQAIAAARAGDMGQARAMANKAVESDPQNENALYLMSALVESDDERHSYLNQLLLINPDHVGAKKYLSEFSQSLEEEADEFDADREPIDDIAVAAVGASQIDESWLSLDEEEIDLEQPEVEEIPDWLTDEELDADVEGLSEAAAGSEVEELQEVPDWLADEPSDGPIEEISELEVVIDEEPVVNSSKPAGQPKKASSKGPSNKALTIILIFLLVIAVAIVGGIAYLMVTQFVIP